jgi:signal transduction histidine kinase
MSPRLQNLLRDSSSRERVVVPLKDKWEGHEIIVGMVHLENPMPRLKKEISSASDNDTYLKRSLLFKPEDLRLAEELAFPLQRIVRMLRLVEEQTWLVNELSHSLGQDLQLLRNAVNLPMRVLGRTKNETGVDVRTMANDIDWCFKVIDDARQRISHLTSIRSPNQEYPFEETLIKEMIQECCDFMVPRARSSGHRIYYGHVRDIRPVALAKPYMRIAVLNLLDNAWKYSWSRREIRVVANEDASGTIRIQVTNWGIGIPSEHADRIFEPYFRSKVPDAHGRRYGTGIGLAIVKQTIEDIHKGKVFFNSEPLKRINSRSGASIDNIVNVEYETTFTIELQREALNIL